MNRQGRLFHYSKPASGASLAALTPDLKSHLRVSFWAPDVSSDSLEGCPRPPPAVRPHTNGVLGGGCLIAALGAPGQAGAAIGHGAENIIATGLANRRNLPRCALPRPTCSSHVARGRLAGREKDSAVCSPSLFPWSQGEKIQEGSHRAAGRGRPRFYARCYRHRSRLVPGTAFFRTLPGVLWSIDGVSRVECRRCVRVALWLRR
jgi:hypothetical protein